MQQEWITQAARDFARRHVYECELMEEGMPIPVIWMEDALVHTDENSYECDDPDCICHPHTERIPSSWQSGMVRP